MILSADKCIHHYVIDTPNGSMVIGTCRKCGHAREFITAGTGYGVDRDTPYGRKSRFGDLVDIAR